MKVLSIIQGALGDGVMALWALKAVANRTGCSLDLVCSPGLGALARDLGLARSAFPVQSPDMSSLFGPSPSQRAKERIQSHDLTLAFSFSKDLFNGVEALSPWAVQVPPRPGPAEKIHVLDHLLGRLHEAGLSQFPSRERDPALPGAFDLHDRSVRKRGLPALIHPGSGSSRKNLPLSLYADLFLALRKQGVPALFVLGPDDHALITPLKELLPEAPLKRPESVPDFKACLLESRAYVGNDSGATHLAAMLGVPTAALFGPSDPIRWSPVGPRVWVSRPSLACEPCFETSPENCETPLCLSNASPAEALKALEGLDVL